MEMKHTNRKDEIAVAVKSRPQPESSAITMDSREKLLAAALHLFAARGVDRVSVRDIASEAGVNSALVGYYFRSKDGLLSQL